MASDSVALVTRAEEWMKRESPRNRPWIEHDSSPDGYDVVFSEGEEPPLDWGAGGPLAQGGYGSVYTVKSKISGDEYVVKTLHLPTAEDEKSTFSKKVKLEVAAMRKVSHYHVIESFGSYVYRQLFGILLKRATCDLATVLHGFNQNSEDQTTLQRLWRREPQDWLPSITGCLAAALAHIHANGVRHKDIKPSNILMDGQRVAFADFGISRVIGTFTGSRGPTAVTEKYAPPEALNEDYRNRSQDVFSLGCVFLEIFAVYKGERVEMLHKNIFGTGETKRYADRTQEALSWMKKHQRDRCDVQFIDLIRRMLADKPKSRPSSKRVWLDTTIISSHPNEGAQGIHFCGSCCMPAFVTDRISAISPTEPSPLAYRIPLTYPVRPRPLDEFGADPHFEKVYSDHDMVTFDWLRNLRICKQSILDSVRSSQEPYPICRKRVWPKDDSLQSVEDARQSALAEAETLSRLQHRHLVRLKGTYRQGDCFALMIQPVADREMKYHLRMVGPEDRTLREAFGCLANALAYLHDNDVVHGDIRLSNVFVTDDGRLFLGELGSASIQRRLQSIVRTHEYVEDGADADEGNRYYAPEFSRPRNLTRSADIYSLGVVFLEIETVRRSRSLEEMGQHDLTDWPDLLNVDTSISPPEFYAMLKRMVAFNPEVRPSAHDVLATMQTCYNGRGNRLCGHDC